MKKYSFYFWTCMMTAVFSAMCASIFGYYGHPSACAVLCVATFISWYAGVMAPDDEKYTEKYNNRNRRVGR